LSHKETKEQKEICPGEAGYVAQSAHVSILKTKLTYAYGNIFKCLQQKYVSASEASRIFLYFLEFLVQHYLTKKQRTKRKYVPAKPDMWRKAPMSLF
jgi:hypothetical protein